MSRKRSKCRLHAMPFRSFCAKLLANRQQVFGDAGTAVRQLKVHIARLQFVRQHFRADEMMIKAGQRQQQFAPPPQHRVMRAEHFVKTEHVNIRTTGLHIDQPVRRVGHTIHAQPAANRMHTSGDFCNRVDGAEHIRGMRDRDPFGARTEKPLQIGEFEVQGVAIHFPNLDHRTRLLKPHPAADIGFVIAIGNDDFVAGSNARQQRRRQNEHQRGGSRAHHHFIFMRGIDQFGNRAAR